MTKMGLYSRQRHAKHLCASCGTVDENTMAGHWLCAECAAYKRKRYRMILGPQYATRYQERRANHLCGKCGAQDDRTLSGMALCERCAERNRLCSLDYKRRVTERAV